MKAFTVGDLRKKMQELALSPEDFSNELPISNMTIRRWLDKEDSFVIPEKYQIYFQNKTSKIDLNSDFAKSFKNIESQILEDGKKHIKNTAFLKKVKSLMGKMKSNVSIFNQASTLLDIYKMATSNQAKYLALGALAYFVNPFDIVPDGLGFVGFIDDIGVMTYVLTKLQSTR